MKRIASSVLGISLALAGGALAAEELKLDEETARINYSVGYQIGGDFKRQGVGLDPEAVVKGIEDALSGGEPLMSRPDMQKTLADLKKKILVRQQLKKGEEAEKLRVEGRAFMETNAKKDGAKTTASGLQYRIIEEGSGKSPDPTDTVTVNYRGTLINGQEFDSSYKRQKPATFGLNRVIKGWTEGLQLMKEGGKAEFVIPPDLAYGDRGPLRDQTLIFEVELLSVAEKAAPQTAKQAKPSADD